MSQCLRYHTIMAPSSAGGAEGPAANPLPAPAAGHPSLLTGGPRPIGEIARKVCITAGEKALVRLNARAATLSAALDELRQDETLHDHLIDPKTQALSQVRAEIEAFEAKLAVLKGVRA